MNCLGLTLRDERVGPVAHVPFSAGAFRRGYDLSYIPSLPLKWIAVVISAISAGVCEETGFRGYMQRPIEQRHGAATAILVSFTARPISETGLDWSFLVTAGVLA